MNKYIVALIGLFSMIASMAFSMDLIHKQDSVRVLLNPDKGLYHHYYDNQLGAYLTKQDSDLDNMPNMHHLFLRFAWAYLEPSEGNFNWRLIDDIVDKWGKKGYKISLSITCCETGETYATPQWVKNAGAKGGFYKVGWMNVWEPEYGDPVFLEKLDNLHRRLAERYDGTPFLTDMTIASYGNWGEGHCSFTSNRPASNETVIKHIEIYRKHYKQSQLVIGDDWLKWERTDDEYQALRAYVKAAKISYRDDSILVPWWYQVAPATASIDKPELFDDAWVYAPTTLEMDHYKDIVKAGLWKGINGSEFGGDVVKEAARISHCTFFGYHGYADVFLQDNPDLVNELANYVGYWLFIDRIQCGGNADNKEIEFVWNNKGVAPPYQSYALSLRFVSLEDGSEYLVDIPEADSRKWMPGKTTETYPVNLPSTMPRGSYQLQVGLIKKQPAAEYRPIELGFKTQYRCGDGFYNVGNIKY